jgi:RNA polymerase sigma factor (sigma-70 family)
MIKNYSEEQIIQMIQNGGLDCENAYNALVRHFEPIIFAFASRHGANKTDAEDIAAETFTAVTMNIIRKKYSPERPLGVYFKVIYARKTIKYVHRKDGTLKNIVSSLQNSEDSDILNGVNLSNLSDPYDAILNDDLQFQMQRAIQHLQEKCKILFDLTFLNYKMKEIGEKLLEKKLIEVGSNLEDAAKSQHKRCKEGLKEIIKNKYPELVNYHKQ